MRTMCLFPISMFLAGLASSISAQPITLPAAAATFSNGLACTDALGRVRTFEVLSVGGMITSPDQRFPQQKHPLGPQVG